MPKKSKKLTPLLKGTIKGSVAEANKWGWEILLTKAEKEVQEGKTRPMATFLKDFKNARKVQR